MRDEQEPANVMEQRRGLRNVWLEATAAEPHTDHTGRPVLGQCQPPGSEVPQLRPVLPVADLLWMGANR
jgi:hypothetical protein